MLSLFRNFFKSKFGIAVTLGFLALIALAFASADVSSSGQFGGVTGNDLVALVGDEEIGTGELNNAANNALQRMKQEQPTLTMPAFLAADGLNRVLDDLIDRYAIAEFGEEIGIRAGDRLVDSEIASIPAFKGPDGKFSSELFRQAIRQQGISEAQVRKEIAQSLYARQVLGSTGYQARVPQGLAVQYAALLKEKRSGAIAVLPSKDYLPKVKPTAKQVDAYYAANTAKYIRPERRVIRYATFGESALKGSIKPTDAEIAARYKRDAGQYAASESRSFSQLVAATESQAKAISADVKSGRSLSAAASANGLAVSKTPAMTKPELTEAASAAVANAVFAARKGEVTAPVRGSLGWYVLQVDTIATTPARTLDQARGDIVKALTEEKRRAAIADLGAQIEDEVDSGSSLNDLAKSLGVDIQSTKPLTADGEVYGADGEAPAVLKPALASAFAMDEGEPQMAEIEPGKTFIIYDVASITPSAPAPLAEIRKDVEEAAWQAEGLAAAKAGADRVLQRVRKGESLAKAVAAEKKPVPPVDNVNFSRDDLAQMGDRVPSPIALFFAMAQGTVKKLEAQNDAGWFIVALDKIVPGKVDAKDPIVAAAQSQLGPTIGEEYETQFRAAIRKQMGVERNDSAIAAVRKRLAGDSSGEN